jgi:diguanylate cyclase (GGDEF)-like protein/PAS domain S-box-containing protein
MAIRARKGGIEKGKKTLARNGVPATGGDLAADWMARMVAAAPNLACRCKEGRILFLNLAGAKLLGLASEAEAEGRPFADFVHPDYRHDLEAMLLEAAQAGEAIPLKLATLDGRLVDVDLRATPTGAEGDLVVWCADLTERIRVATTLRDREERLQGIMNVVPDGIVTIDEKGIIRSANPAVYQVFGYAPGELIGRNVSILMPEPHAGRHDQYLRNYRKTGDKHIIGVTGREEIARRKDGKVFPVELAVVELKHRSERLFIGMVRDITRRKRAEEALLKAYDELELRIEERTRELTREVSERRAAEEGLRLAAEVINNLSEAVIIVDTEFRISSVNPAFTDITGFEANDVLGQVPRFYSVVARDPLMFAQMWKSLKSDGTWATEIWNQRKNGEKYAERLSISVLADEAGNVQKYAVVIADITKRKQDEERIRYQANYDSLTGLPNRALFMDRLSQALATMGRVGKKLGLMFIDLDGFKLVNDTLGHEIGDLLLKEAAERLATCVRTGDTVARLGGDEFTIIMPNLTDPRNAPLLAQRILDTLAKPFVLKGQEAFVSGSIGITIFPDDATKASELIKNADAAMYRAKEQGKASYHFFTADLNEEVKQRLVLKNGLSKALERNELILFYQPKMDLVSNRVHGCEALMRWQNPDLGMVSPARFIPVLEETGIIVEVGEWAIRTACRQYRAWVDSGLPPIRIAVNLSARQIRDGTLASTVARILDETEVPPEGLELEITESMLMTDAQKSVVALEELHRMGIHVAMDDFGTGYSSLSYLKRFPIDTIKIDRSFVADIASNPDDAEIIKTIITMGQTLNRRVVAEGVETEEQLRILRNYKCDEIQGYLLSPPLPPEKFEPFVKAHKAKTA